MQKKLSDPQKAYVEHIVGRAKIILRGDGEQEQDHWTMGTALIRSRT